MRALASVLLVAVACAAPGCGSAEDGPDTRPGPAAARASATLFLLPVRGNELIRVDAASGRTEAVRRPELGLGGDPPFRLVRTGGRLVAWGLVDGRVGAVALSDDLNGAARLLGPASFFVPSGTAGRVWLARIDPESPETVKDLGTLVEVDVDGRTTTPAVHPPRGAALVGAVGDGLLFQRDGLELWDPRSATVLRRLPGPFPAASREAVLAWCEAGCPLLHLTDIVTGDDVAVPPGDGFAFEETYDGAFSPDGRRIAVPARTGDGRVRVAIVDVETRTASLVPGSELAEYHALAWSHDGWLYMVAPKGRVLAYGPGANAAVALPVRIDRPIFALVAGG